MMLIDIIILYNFTEERGCHAVK